MNFVTVIDPAHALHVFSSRRAATSPCVLFLVSFYPYVCCLQTLAEHRQLAAEAAAHGVMVAVEFHKRWDPIYDDARARIAGYGAPPAPSLLCLRDEPWPIFRLCVRYMGRC
jgi:hypothetical protein